LKHWNSFLWGKKKEKKKFKQSVSLCPPLMEQTGFNHATTVSPWTPWPTTAALDCNFPRGHGQSDTMVALLMKFASANQRIDACEIREEEQEKKERL